MEMRKGMNLFKIFSKGADKPDSSEEKPEADYRQKWWVETTHVGDFVVKHKSYAFCSGYFPAITLDIKEVGRYSTLEEAVAFCEDQIGSYEFKPETVWGPKP